MTVATLQYSIQSNPDIIKQNVILSTWPLQLRVFQRLMTGNRLTRSGGLHLDSRISSSGAWWGEWSVHMVDLDVGALGTLYCSCQARNKNTGRTLVFLKYIYFRISHLHHTHCLDLFLVIFHYHESFKMNNDSN